MSASRALIPAASLIALVASTCAGVASASTTGDVALLQSRLQSLACQGSSGNASQWVNTQMPDGSWMDMRYDDHAIANWPPANHMQRLAEIATAYGCKGVGWRPSAAETTRALSQGLAFWIKANPQSGNWWHNSIGVPTWLNKVLVLARDRLSVDTVRQALTLYPDFDKIPPDRMTGQNLVWYAREMLVMGLVNQDAARIEKAVRLIQGAVKVTQAEGIQADLSFHQHGPQLYSAGYGLQLFRDAGEMAWTMRDTAWAFPKADVDGLISYGLGGIVPFFRPGWVDWGASGREFTRANAVRDKTDGLLVALRRAKDLSPERTSEIEGIVKGLSGSSRAPVWQGTRYFWRSDMLVHQSDQWYVSIKASSSSTVATESGNGENLKGYWLGFGQTLFLRRGDEYNDILGGFDWQAIPGVSALNRVPDFTGYQRNEAGPTLGIVQGSVSMVNMQVAKLGLRAQKSWLMLGDALYCAGAVASTEPATTWVNQVSAHGDVRAANQGVNDGEIWHDGVAYLPMSGYKLAYSVQSNADRTAVINTDLGPSPKTQDVFKVWADPQDKAGRYAYMVVPARRPGVGAQALQQGATLLANDANARAFTWSDATGTHLAAFVQKKVELTWAGAKLSFQQPGLYLLNKTAKQRELLFTAEAAPHGSLLNFAGAAILGEGMQAVVDMHNVWRQAF